MDILDDKRIEAITPYYKYYGLQDLLPRLELDLRIIRLQQLADGDPEYKINGWNADFDITFKQFYPETKQILIKKIQEKYHDFDQIIMRTSQNMKSQFQESGKSKLLQAGVPHSITLKHRQFDNDKLRFVIVVHETGRGHKCPSEYHLSAGKFFIMWHALL